MTDVLPEPGDLCVVNTLNQASAAVQLLQWLSTRKFSQWNHVCVCTSVSLHGEITIAEAEASGAVLVPWHYEDVPHQWSTGVLPTNAAVAAAAARYTQPGPWGPHGVPYSWLDYAAIAARRWHVPVPGLRGFIKATGHMMCSQLADACKQAGNVHLFEDNRWAGYVAPDDIGALLPAGQWTGAWKWTGAKWQENQAQSR